MRCAHGHPISPPGCLPMVRPAPPVRFSYETWTTEQAERAHPSARVARKEAAGELLTMIAWPMAVRWVAGVCAERPRGVEAEMTLSV
jgi:hypothetical protein